MTWPAARKLIRPATLGIALSSLTAQTQAPAAKPTKVSLSELIARQAQGHELWATQWVVRDDGMLMQRCEPRAEQPRDTKDPTNANYREFADTAGLSQKPGWDPLVASARVLMPHWATASSWIAPLLRHPGDLLGATFAEHHFSKLGRDPSTASLRQFLITPDQPLKKPLLRRLHLDRELAIRVLHQRHDVSARKELGLLAQQTQDPFLRRAANEALAELDNKQRPANIKLRELPIEVPTTADFWLLIDSAHIPPARALPLQVRKGSIDYAWSLLINDGEADTNSMAHCQRQIDLPDEMPYELARSWGRTRVDQCLIAIGGSNARPCLNWAAASGCFEVDVLAAYLATRQIAYRLEDGVLRSKQWWPDFHIEVAPNYLTVNRNTHPKPTARVWPPLLDQAELAGAGLAIASPADSGISTSPWLPGSGALTATLKLTPFELTISKAMDPARAHEACRSLSDAAGTTSHEQLTEQVLSRWQQAFRNAEISPVEEGNATRIRIRSEKLSLWELWPLTARER